VIQSAPDAAIVDQETLERRPQIVLGRSLIPGVWTIRIDDVFFETPLLGSFLFFSTLMLSPCRPTVLVANDDLWLGMKHIEIFYPPLFWASRSQQLSQLPM